MNTEFSTKSVKVGIACCLSAWLTGYAFASGNDLPRVVRKTDGPALELPKQAR